MEESRSTWQMWHVRAEAQRQVRTIDVPAEHAAALVDLLVDEVLDRRSVALAAPADNVEEPEVLRRVDGSSVYTVAGADLYTSQRILDAEQRLVAAAGRRDGASGRSGRRWIWLCWRWRRTEPHSMPGRPHWSARCAPPGARLQLAIAPAGAGKTTAMRALTLAWTEDWRPGDRPGPVGCRSRCPCRADRDPRRHTRQTHLVTCGTATCRTGRPRSARRPW